MNEDREVSIEEMIELSKANPNDVYTNDELGLVVTAGMVFKKDEFDRQIREIKLTAKVFKIYLKIKKTIFFWKK